MTYDNDGPVYSMLTGSKTCGNPAFGVNGQKLQEIGNYFCGVGDENASSAANAAYNQLLSSACWTSMNSYWTSIGWSQLYAVKANSFADGDCWVIQAQLWGCCNNETVCPQTNAINQSLSNYAPTCTATTSLGDASAGGQQGFDGCSSIAQCDCAMGAGPC
jgi:hypothetical protein